MQLKYVSLSPFLVGLAFAQTTERVSVDSGGAQANNYSDQPSISRDGRFVAFSSRATNLVPGDARWDDVFLHDRSSGQTSLLSVAYGGGASNGSSYRPVLSADGSFAAFWTTASDVYQGDVNLVFDVVVRDLGTGINTCVSRSSSGVLGNGHSYAPALSADARWVAFHSFATNLVTGDTNGTFDVFVRDRATGQTTRASLDSNGVEGNGASRYPTISDDGRWVAFESAATNLVVGDTNGNIDAFVHDRQTGVTRRVNVGAGGVQADAEALSIALAGGRWVTFASMATNLVSGDTNGWSDVFVHDLVTQTTTRASLGENGTQADASSLFPSLSNDGRYLVFSSHATNLTSVPDLDGVFDLYRRDLWFGGVERINVSTSGVQADQSAYLSATSADGRITAFPSAASNLVLNDTNAQADIFVRELGCPAAIEYCTAKTNSLGCTPTISLSGVVSASSGSGATLTASNVLGVKPGLFFHGVGAPTATPFHGGWLCVAPPVRRHAVMSSGGTLGACDGTYTEDLNAYIASGADPALVAGATLGLQCWSRDPGDPSGFGDGLTSAVHATICP